jgi:hypothetical protein
MVHYLSPPQGADFCDTDLENLNLEDSQEQQSFAVGSKRRRGRESRGRHLCTGPSPHAHAL